MRPVKLTMQAFGPFAGREVVDFRDAVAAGLFGIYGQTGSGKSTIFSAMTFALFGEAAKTEQDTSSLRSDRADPALTTEVEFIFEIGDRRYVARRHPEQMRPKLRGEGETKVPHEAWLFDATGIAVEDISEARSGKIIAEKKHTTVNKAVTDLLGYKVEQFRQIVLLPQGRFETFLAAKTDERLKILRELFDVSIYQRITKKLKDEAAAIERQVTQEREVCAGRLRTEGFESPDALAEGIVSARVSCATETEREAEAARTVSDVRTKLETDRRLDEKFSAAANAKTELDALLQQDEHIAALKKRVSNAQRAQSLGDVEAHWLRTRKDVDDAANRRKETTHTSTAAAGAAHLAEQALKAEQARAAETEGLRKKSDELERHLATLAGATALEAAARDVGLALVTAQSAFEAVEQRFATISGQKQSAETLLKVAREKEAQRHSFTAQRTSLEAALKAAKEYEKAKQALEAARRDVARLTPVHAAAAELESSTRSRFQAAEAELAAIQAVHLAAKLRPGEACPVCGSTEHPAPATGRIENGGLDAAFRDAKTAWEKAREDEQGRGRDVDSAKVLVTERDNRLSGLEKIDRSAMDLQAEIDGLNEKVRLLGPETDIPAADARLELLSDQTNDVEEKRNQCRDARETARQNDVLARDRLQQALSTIPEGLRQRDSLDAALAEARAMLNTRQEALNKAVEKERAAREAALSATNYAEAAITAENQAVGRRDEARATFEARLAEHGLTEPLYQSYKASIASIETDSAVVNDHEAKLSGARAKEQAAQAAIAGCARPDLKPMEGALDAAEEARKQATERRAEAAARQQHLEKVQDEIAASLRRLDEIELESGPLRDLAKLFNAENPQRLDLETFAIGAMFDQVLVAANLRLRPMTAGRYTLQRETEGGDARSRRGLGILVFDIFTGKARAPATLSGGETFIAALALALGLSDVVESVSGKVRLDTIFIDEGFGSLDTENDSGTLDQVLQVLTKLIGQTRAIGLISHVPLVQDAIPNGFYVRKEIQGSRVETRGAV